jgi:hypothetical protein
MNINGRLNRLEDAAGVGKKVVSMLVVNPGESVEQAWRRTSPGIPYPTEDEKADRYAAFVTLDLNCK